MLTLMLAAHVSATAHCATLIRAWFSDLGFDWEHERAQLAQILELLEAVVLLPIPTSPSKAGRVPRNFRTPSIT
jgi:hypothetical protein